MHHEVPFTEAQIIFQGLPHPAECNEDKGKTKAAAEPPGCMAGRGEGRTFTHIKVLETESPISLWGLVSPAIITPGCPVVS